VILYFSNILYII